MINNTQLPPLQGGNAGASGYVMEGGMMRQVDEMDEDMAGMDEYGVSTIKYKIISLHLVKKSDPKSRVTMHNCHILGLY